MSQASTAHSPHPPLPIDSPPAVTRNEFTLRLDATTVSTLHLAECLHGCVDRNDVISHRAGFSSFAELHNSTVGVDVATGRKYELNADVLLQCYEIYAVLKAENDVGMSGRQRREREKVPAVSGWSNFWKRNFDHSLTCWKGKSYFQTTDIPLLERRKLRAPLFVLLPPNAGCTAS